MRILANLNVAGTLDIDTVANAGVDTDRFLVQDANGVVKYRTGSEVASDIGATVGFVSTVKHLVKLGENISKGQAVYISSADGTNMIVMKASNDSEAASSKVLGLLETGGVTNDQVYVITEGLLPSLNTSTATAGDEVWLATAGNLIFGNTNKPYAPANLVFLGVVTRANTNNGEIFVKVQNGSELEELHNVQITTTPANNTVLAYETSSSLYKMKSIPTLLGFTPFANPMTTLGDIIYGGASGVATRLAGNTTTTKQYLSQTGTGSASAAPVWASFNTDARAAISLTTNGTSGVATYDNGTGILNIPNYVGNTGIRLVYNFTATAGQTTFSVSYTPSLIDVFYNGSRLNESEYTATNGTTIVLGTACIVNDIVDIVVYQGNITGLSGVAGSGTANQITYWTGTNTLGALSTSTYPSLTELSYVKGVTSSIQNQLDGKQPLFGNQNANLVYAGPANGAAASPTFRSLVNADLPDSGVTAGTYNDSATQVKPFTVNAKGLITGVGTAVTITPAWSSITSKPTTISGFGITDAYTKTEVDSFLQGLDPKASVKAATTGAITLSGEQTIDDISVVAGDRVLVKDQSPQTTNGIYIVSASGWSRSSDMDASAELPGAYVFVERGTANADKGFVCTNDSVSLGSTNITFAQFSGTGAYQAVLNGTGFVRMNGTSVSYITGTSSQFVKADGTLDGTSYQTLLTNPVTGSGTNGQVTYWNGGSTVTGSAAFTFSPNGQFYVAPTNTAGAGVAYGLNLNPTLVAGANGDVLSSILIRGTFTNGAYTGVQNWLIIAEGSNNRWFRYNQYGLWSKQNDNTHVTALNLENAHGVGWGVGMNFTLGYDGTGSSVGTPIVGARIEARPDTSWTSTASTQDSSLILSTTLNGTLGTALTLKSDKSATFEAFVQMGGDLQLLGGNPRIDFPDGSSLRLYNVGTGTALELTSGRTLRLPSYTSNGFLKTSSADGTVIVDTTSYQPLLTNPVTGTGGSTEIAVFTGTSTVGGYSGLKYVDPKLTVGVSASGNNIDYSILVQRHGTSAAPGDASIIPALQIVDYANLGYTTYSVLGIVDISAPRISIADTNSGNTQLLRISNDDLTIMHISAKGNVFIGQSSQTDNGQRLQVNGTTRLDGNVTLANGSDLIITPATSGVNATLYNDIGKLVSTASLVVNGTGEFSNDLSTSTDLTVSGKAGIGAAPQSGISLYIKGNGVDSPLLKMQGFANTTAMIGDTTTGTSDVGNLWLYNDGTLRIRLDSDTGGLSYINANRFIVGATTSTNAKFRVRHDDTDATYFSKIQAVFGPSDYLDSDSANVFGGGTSETQFTMGNASRPAMLSIGGNINVDEALGVINFFRSNNTDGYRSRIQIFAQGQSTGTANQHGAYLEFRTANDGVQNPAALLQLEARGALRIFRRDDNMTFPDSVGAFYVRQNGNHAGTEEEFRIAGRNIGFFSHTGTRHAGINSSGVLGVGYAGSPAATSKIFVSRGDQYGLHLDAQSGFARIQTTDDNLYLNSGGVDRLALFSNGFDLQTSVTGAAVTQPITTIRETGISRTMTGYNWDVVQPLVMMMTETSPTILGLTRFSNDAVGAGLKGIKARGSASAPLSPANGDICFAVEGYAIHGAGPNYAKFGGGMRFVKDDAWGTANTQAPMRTEFYNANSTTTVQTTMIIYPSGNVTVTGEVTASKFFESSDIRLKSNIRDYINTDISKISAKVYEKDGIVEVGYVAQDVEDILGCAIGKRKDGYLDLSYRQIHTAKISMLEKEIRELKEQLKQR